METISSVNWDLDDHYGDKAGISLDFNGEMQISMYIIQTSMTMNDIQLLTDPKGAFVCKISGNLFSWAECSGNQLSWKIYKTWLDPEVGIHVTIIFLFKKDVEQ